MYTNVDTFLNKRTELLFRIQQCNPDILGLTEIKPKNASWELSAHELDIRVTVCIAIFVVVVLYCTLKTV